MNKQSSASSAQNLIFSISVIHSLPILFVLFGILIFTNDCLAQTATWRYVATLPGSIKSYLNDEVKILPDKNKIRWEKMIKSDGSSATALVEWNCADKLRRTRQITFYNADDSVIGTKKKGFNWSPIIPGSSGDFLYRRVCSAMTQQTAEITLALVDLRAFPDNDAPITGTAKRGERFQIAPESGQGGWFNLVDPKTQQDYWLTNNDFKIIEAQSAPNEPQAAGGKSSRRAKPKARTRKN